MNPKHHWSYRLTLFSSVLLFLGLLASFLPLLHITPPPTWFFHLTADAGLGGLVIFGALYQCVFKKRCLQKAPQASTSNEQGSS